MWGGSWLSSSFATGFFLSEVMSQELRMCCTAPRCSQFFKHLFCRTLCACSGSQVFSFKMLVQLLYHFPILALFGGAGTLGDGVSCKSDH